MSRQKIDHDELGEDMMRLRDLIVDYIILKNLSYAEVDRITKNSKGYTSHFINRSLHFPSVETLVRLRNYGFPIFCFFLPEDPKDCYQMILRDERMKAYLDKLKEYEKQG